LIPVLLPFISDHIALHVYYGSRASQPKRVRAFLDLAFARLVDSPAYVLSGKELSQSSRSWSRRRA
jgi:hypothetical protein